MKKKPFDKTEVYIKSAFRKIWRWSKGRRECLKNAKGRCQICKKKVKKLYADHIEPVAPVDGLRQVPIRFYGIKPENPNELFVTKEVFHVDYNQLYERMFYNRLQAICKPCHSNKSKKENKQRREFKKRGLNAAENSK